MYIILPAILVMFVLVCFAVEKQPELKSDTSKPTILIAVQKKADSGYKQDLIKMIEEEYSSDYLIRVKLVKSYKDVINEQYQALIVMDQLKAWLWFNGAFKGIIKHTDSSKAVYFMSSGNPKWKWKRDDIDIITSATNKVSPDHVFSEIKAQLDTILKP